MKKLILLDLFLAILSPMVLAEDNSFTYALFSKLQQTENGNIIVSPFSVEQAIGMVANGAKGATLDELLNLNGDESLAALNLRNQNSRTVLDQHANDSITGLKITNSVWHLPSFALLPMFKDSVQLRYNAHIDTTNFAMQQGVERVNQWVSDGTDQMIPSIYDEPQSDLAISLINTTLFRGHWSGGMHAYLSSKGAFQNADGSGTSVDIVTLNPNNPTRLYMNNEFVAAEAAFITQDYGYNYHVLFILPVSAHQMPELTYEAWTNLMQNLQYVQTRIMAPKFDINYKKELLPTIQNMGGFIHGDFSGVSEGNVFVNSIKHFSRLTLDEDGMSAAAATVIDMPTGMPEDVERVELELNRPFYIAILSSEMTEPIFLARINHLDGEDCPAPEVQDFALGINNIATTSVTKQFVKGQLLIHCDDKTYNAQGIRVK